MVVATATAVPAPRPEPRLASPAGAPRSRRRSTPLPHRPRAPILGPGWAPDRGRLVARVLTPALPRRALGRLGSLTKRGLTLINSSIRVAAARRCAGSEREVTNMNFGLSRRSSTGPGSPGPALRGGREQVVNAAGWASPPTPLSSTSSSRSSPCREIPLRSGASARSRTKQIRFRTLGHVLPYTTRHPGLADRRRDILSEAVTIRCAPRPRLDSAQGRRAARRDARPLRGVVEILFHRAQSRSGSPTTAILQDRRLACRPASVGKVRVFLGGTSDRTYELAPRAAGPWSCPRPPVRGAPGAARPLPSPVRRATARTPDIVWIHACYLDEDRDTGAREAERA